MSEIFRGTPESVTKNEGIVKNVPIFEFQAQKKQPVRSDAEREAELENTAAFRRRIIEAVQNKQQTDQETAKKLPFGLSLLILAAALLNGSAKAIAGEELEQIGIKEKGEKSA